ncbi:MAG: NADH-quinone oxidoreductase subunit N [Fimbriimonadaceae bacterium]
MDPSVSDIVKQFQIPTDLDFNLIMPTLMVALTGIFALLMQVVQKKRDNRPIIFISLVGLLCAAGAVVRQFGMPDAGAFAGMVLRDQFTLVTHLILIFACAMTLVFSEGYLQQKKIAFSEFYPLVTWATCGGMIMVSTNNLLVMFLGLEMLSIALYVLAGMSRSEQRSEESAIKYFLLGAFASAFFLYGIAFFFGTTGSLDLTAMSAAYSAAPQNGQVMALFGVMMLLIGLAFKSGMVPFHQWTPDVYQGAPTNVTAFMAVGSKVAAIAALYRVFQEIRPMADVLMTPLMVIAGLTMVIGNVVALRQKDIKRVLGYSSIAHAGYLLTGLLANYVAPDKAPSVTTLYFLVSYAFVTLGSFAVISLIAKDGKEVTKIDELKGLYRRSPFAAIALLLFMVSLIGIPPTAGFVGKLKIFQDALAADLAPLAIILAISSVISVYYYLVIAHKAFVEEDAERATMPITKPVMIASVICMAGVILAGIFNSPVTSWLSQSEPEPEVTASK